MSKPHIRRSIINHNTLNLKRDDNILDLLREEFDKDTRLSKHTRTSECKEVYEGWRYYKDGVFTNITVTPSIVSISTQGAVTPAFITDLINKVNKKYNESYNPKKSSSPR